MSDGLDDLDRLLAERDAAKLGYLRNNWGDVYSFTIDPAGKWVALSKSDPAAAPLIAGTGEDLHRMVWEAYGPHSAKPTDNGSL